MVLSGYPRRHAPRAPRHGYPDTQILEPARRCLIDRLGVNSLVWGNYHITLARAGWRYVPNARLLFQAAGAWMRERFDNLNRDSRPLGAGTYGEWVGNANATWYWTGRNALEAGWSARRLRSEGFESSYILNSDSVRVRDRYRGTALRQGGYAQQSWSALHNRVRLSAGFRWDRHDLAAPTPLSAHAAAGFGLTSTTQLQLGWGQYVQYPDMQLIDLYFVQDAEKKLPGAFQYRH